MEPFWLVAGLVVSAYKIEQEEREAAALAAAEAAEGEDELAEVGVEEGEAEMEGKKGG